MDHETDLTPFSSPAEWPATGLSGAPAAPAVRRGPRTVVVVTVVSLVCTTLLWLALVGLSLAAANRPTADPFTPGVTIGADEAAADHELVVGDCFAQGPSSADGLVVVDCAESHDGEIVAVVPGAGATWAAADDEERDQVVIDVCFPAFAAYTGVEYEDSVLDVVGARYGNDSAEAGDPVICIVEDPAGPSSGSARADQTPDQTVTV